MGERPTPQDATAEMKYAELRPPVQDHVRNLRTQLFELARKYGKQDPNDLRALVENGDIPMEDVERITSLMLAMTESFKDDRLSKEAVEGIENQLEMWSELVDAVDETLRFVIGRRTPHTGLDSARIARMFQAIFDRDPVDAVRRIEAIGPRIVNFQAFSDAIVPVCAEAGDFKHAYEAAERLGTGGLREHAFEIIARAAIKRGDADYVIASFGRLNEMKQERISLDAVRAFLFDHRDPVSARRFVSRLGREWTGRAAAEFARYAAEPGVDSSGLLATAREMIRDIDLTYCSDEGGLGYVTAFALLCDSSEVRRVVKQLKTNEFPSKNTVAIAEAIAAGGQFELARAIVEEASSMSSTKSSAYRAIARAEVLAGRDPSSSLALAEGTYKFPQKESDANVIDAATAYVATGREARLEAALGRVNPVSMRVATEKSSAELIRAMGMRPKRCLRAIDRVLARFIRELVDEEVAIKECLALAEAELTAGIDPSPTVKKALLLLMNSTPEHKLKLFAPVFDLARRLGVPVAESSWKDVMNLAQVYDGGLSLARLAIARIESGLSIEEQLRSLEITLGKSWRCDALADVAHAIFLRANETMNLLPPAEQRRLRRKFGIMEPKER